jgi:hypothetical protein
MIHYYEWFLTKMIYGYLVFLRETLLWIRKYFLRIRKYLFRIRLDLDPTWAFVVKYLES